MRRREKEREWERERFVCDIRYRGKGKLLKATRLIVRLLALFLFLLLLLGRISRRISEYF